MIWHSDKMMAVASLYVVFGSYDHMRDVADTVGTSKGTPADICALVMIVAATPSL